MGAICCCLGQEDFEEYSSYSNGYAFQHCLCVRCCVRWFIGMYSAFSYTVEGHDISPSIQGVTSSSSELIGVPSPDGSSPDTYRAPPRPLPYDVDPRYVRLQRDGLVSRREKTSSHVHGESELLRRSNDDGDAEPLTTVHRWNEVDYEDEGQGYQPESPGKRQSLKTIMRIESSLSLLGDEEICPTCLEGYNAENPKIPTECGHHFHLGCIYEWMERSKNCPVCDKEMVFTESP